METVAGAAQVVKGTTTCNVFLSMANLRLDATFSIKFTRSYDKVLTDLRSVRNFRVLEGVKVVLNMQWWTLFRCTGTEEGVGRTRRRRT